MVIFAPAKSGSFINLSFMFNWKIFLLLSGLLLTGELFSQKNDSLLSVYNDNYQQEKIHIHFDKSIYRKGETIWFKAYLIAGEGLSDFSRNFYLDWYDDLGKLIKHTIHPVFESSARGQFEVPSSYNGGRLHIKAYTQWMLNFDSSFLYSKDILVSHVDTARSQNKIPSVSIHFFPEGGDLINGINTTVAFIANTNSGKPVAVRGAVFNSKKELIDSFVTEHDGMGKFSMEPLYNDQYTCNWIDEFGINHSSNLPKIKIAGATIEAQVLNNKAVFAVKRTEDASSSFRIMHVVATINQKLVYNANINLISKKTVAGEINIENLPTGIMQITVFDANWLPFAERIVFVKNQQYEFLPDLNVINKRLNKRGKNSFEVFVPDSLLSNLSVSVTDAGLFHDSTTNIISQFLLSSDIKGYIHNAAYYFSSFADSVSQHLDLVMLTHGWRRFNWDAIKTRQLPTLRNSMDSDYLQIKGQMLLNNGGKAFTVKPNQTITMIMQAKDSSKQYFLVPVTADGTFKQRGLIFFDTARVFYQLNGDKKLNDIATVKFQYSLPAIDFLRSIPITRNIESDSLHLLRNNQFYTGAEKAIKYYDSAVVLKEVVVTSKIKSSTEILDEKYTSGLFSSKNGYAFDVLNDDRAQGSLDIFHYLQDMVPGMSMSIPILGANGAEDANSNNVPGLTWRDGTPDIFLNEMPSDAGAVMGIQMTDVAYIKVFRPPFMGSTGSGPSGAIVIYTKKPSDVNTSLMKGLGNALVTGYTNYKEFYNPDYSVAQPKVPDMRATLYWNPYLLTDKKNKTAKIDFYNNDVTQKFRVVIEGVNASGKLARLEKIIE